MNKLFNPNEQRLFESCHEVAEISKPLQQFNIAGFNYKVNYFDGKMFSICTDQKWLEYYFDNQLYTHIPKNMLHICQNDFVLWDELENNRIVESANSEFQISHIISIVRRHKDRIELFNFSADKNNDMMNTWYINNLDLLMHFCNYFLGKYSQNIKKLPCYQPLQPKHNISTPEPTANLLIKQHFIKQTKFKSWNGQLNGRNISLNYNEIYYLINLLTGKTSKEISYKMHLSPRTVEGYLSRLKKKLGCHNKSDLLAAMIQSTFIRDFQLEILMGTKNT